MFNTQENIKVLRLKADCKTYAKKEDFKPEIEPMIEDLQDRQRKGAKLSASIR